MATTASTSQTQPQPQPQTLLQQQQQQEPDILPSPFPIPQKTASATINTHHTTATHLSFTDKSVLTLTQSGMLNHWLHIPLLSESPLTDPSTHLLPSYSTSSTADEEEEGEGEGGDGEKRVDASLLPFPHLTATTLLGGTREADRLFGETVAVVVASAALMKQGGAGGAGVEGGGGGARMIVFGLGLDVKDGVGKEVFEELVGLCLEVL